MSITYYIAVSLTKWYLASFCCCSYCHSNFQVNKNPTTYLHSHIPIYSNYDIVKWFQICITFNWLFVWIRVKTCNTVSEFMHSNSDFPLTLACWPMASEHCWQTSNFLSYWPGLARGISTIAGSFLTKNWKFEWGRCWCAHILTFNIFMLSHYRQIIKIVRIWTGDFSSGPVDFSVTGPDGPVATNS